VVNIPVPNRPITIKGTIRREGKDQMPSKNSTPNAYKNRIIMLKNMSAPVFLLMSLFSNQCYVLVYGFTGENALLKRFSV
jgi:hypothetical protein